MKRTFNRMDLLLSALAGAMLMLGIVQLVVVTEDAVRSFLCAIFLIGLVFWPDVEDGKEGEG